jgi:flagellar motor switch protein FliN/FliY
MPYKFDEHVVAMFKEVWSSSICQVLKQISDQEFRARVTDSTPLSEEEALAGLWICFSATGRLSGEIGCFVSHSDAWLLSGLVRREEPQQNAEPSGDFREEVADVFRLFAGVASTGLKSKTQGDVEFAFRGLEPPSWQAAMGFRVEANGPKAGTLRVSIYSDEGVAKSSTAVPTVCTLLPSASEAQKVLAGPAPVSQGKGNIGLLLDIELEAALRFGEREMPLREILNLSSGSVVELNRRVNEPVELLVCGKVVAKGDVVVLDGNYALRVTQIGSPADRMSSLTL